MLPPRELRCPGSCHQWPDGPVGGGCTAEQSCPAGGWRGCCVRLQGHGHGPPGPGKREDAGGPVLIPRRASGHPKSHTVPGVTPLPTPCLRSPQIPHRAWGRPTSHAVPRVTPLPTLCLGSPHFPRRAWGHPTSHAAPGVAPLLSVDLFAPVFLLRTMPGQGLALSCSRRLCP